MSRMTSCRSNCQRPVDPRGLAVLLTRVSSDGIRRQSMTARIADLSLMQQYINPNNGPVSLAMQLLNCKLTAPRSKHRRHDARASFYFLGMFHSFAVSIRNTGECDLKPTGHNPA